MLRRFAGVIGVLGLHLALAGGAAAQDESLQWRVEGGEQALEPTARVRLIVDNRLPVDVVDPALGLVQTAIYLYQGDGPAAAPLAAADQVPGMRLAAVDPMLSSAGRRATVQVEDLDDLDVALGLVIGRAVAVVATPEDETGGVTALRADTADLVDRLRWSVETLIGAGQERQVWEGNVVLVVDRIYTDFLAVRAPRLTQEVVAGNEASPSLSVPVGGILGSSPTATPKSATVLPGARGTTLVRAVSGRRGDLSLSRGMLNVIRIIAEQSATGDFVVRISAETEPLSTDPAR